MEKAYDLKDLVSRFAKHGAQLSEEAVKAMLNETFDWAEESAKISKNPYDDMALIILPQLKKMALEKADKIDGQVG
jgi:hypothetical protein